MIEVPQLVHLATGVSVETEETRAIFGTPLVTVVTAGVMTDGLSFPDNERLSFGASSTGGRHPVLA